MSETLNQRNFKMHILLKRNVFTCLGNYRFGFNGIELDNEMQGDGNTYDFGARIYDSWLGRWLSCDTSMADYPAISPYVFSLNSPIMFNYPDGKDARVTVQKHPTGGGKITISSTIYITGKNASQYKADLYTREAGEIYNQCDNKKENGEFEVAFQIKFVYVEDKSEIKLVDGDNILEFNDNSTSQVHWIRSFSPPSYTVITGHEGSVAKKDAIGASYYSPLHETLHPLGLDERYNFKTGKEMPNKNFENDIMGEWQGNKMNQTHYDNYVEDYSTKPAGEYVLKTAVDVSSVNGEIERTGSNE